MQMDLPPANASPTMRPKRRWWQFSLKSLLVLVFILSLPLGWLAVKRSQQRSERKALATLEDIGARVAYNWTEGAPNAQPPGPAWLRRLLGDDFFVHAVEVYCSGSSLTDEDLPLFQDLAGIKKLYLDESAISDAAVVHLKGLTSLEHLSLLETAVTSPAAAELQRALPHCEIVRYEHSANDGTGYEKIVVNDHYRNFAPIHEAAKQGDVETIEQELGEGVPVDLRVTNNSDIGASYDTTPLMWAAARGQTAAVKRLIEAKADINAQSIHGITPLMAAAGAIETKRGDHRGSLVALLQAGASLELADGERRTAVFYACGAGDLFDDPPDAWLPPKHRLPDPFRLLRPSVRGLIMGGDDSVSWRARSARHGDAPRLQALLRAGAQIGPIALWTKEPLLLAACRAADADRIRLLLAAGADVNHVTERGWDALKVAAADGTAEMFRMILEAGGQIDEQVLYLAAGSEEDADQKVRLLLERGANVNQPSRNGVTPLLASLRSLKSNAAFVLLEAGADPDVRDTEGESTLILAARNGLAAALEQLIELGLDPHERSRKAAHPTALILAAGSRRDAAEKVGLLLAVGADVNARDDHGGTALLAASHVGNMGAVALLADAGADVHITDADGMTPLLLVANRGEEESTFMSEQTGGEAARALIRHGARIDVRNTRGRTAKELAELIEHTQVLDVLDEMQP